MEKVIYENLDIYLNSYLIADKIKCESIKMIDSEGRRKVCFNYEDTKELREAIADYRENDFLARYVKGYLYTKKAISREFREAKRERDKIKAGTITE